MLYVTAGRSSEAEGGVAMAAIDPATGTMIWGKVIPPGPQRPNDALAIRDGLLAWHYVRVDPKDGKQIAPAKFEDLTETSLLQGAMLDAAWTVIPAHRRSGNAYMIGNLYANQLAWNEKIVASPRGGLPIDKTQGNGKHMPSDAPKVWDYTWRSGLGKTQQVEAMVLTADAVLYAGRINYPKTGKATAFFWIVSAETGDKIAEFPLDCPPACDGLAVADGRIYLSLTNGQLLCFGK